MTKKKVKEAEVVEQPKESKSLVLENKETNTVVNELTAQDIVNSVKNLNLDPEVLIVTDAETGEVYELEEVEEIAKVESVEAIQESRDVAVLDSPQSSGDIVRLGDEFSLVGGVSTEQLEASLKVQTEQRRLIANFINSHLQDGIDYGRIHVVGKDRCKLQANCNVEYHWSKKMLFKPGMEKIFSLFGVTSKLEADAEVYAMFPDRKNMAAFKCRIYRGEKEVAEGRGSCDIGGSKDANSAVKIAEKRARMDACLALGFSEFFSQDMEDPDYQSGLQFANEKARMEAEAKDKDEFGLFPSEDLDAPVNNAERAALMKVMAENNYTEFDDILELLIANGIDQPKEMTSGQARQFMGKLRHTKFELKIPEKQPKEEEPEIPEEPEDTPPVQEETLVVDQELKNYLAEQWLVVGLSDYGEKWFMKFAFGKPLKKFGDFQSDAEWRKAYQVLEDILMEKIDVPPQCKAIKGGEE